METFTGFVAVVAIAIAAIAITAIAVITAKVDGARSRLHPHSRGRLHGAYAVRKDS